MQRKYQYWTDEEKRTLIRSVDKYEGCSGQRKWELICRALPNRSAQKCRVFYNQLKKEHQQPTPAEL